jgi:hypothetical protein
MCAIQPIESRVPQGSPVSPILFIIYLGEILKAIKQAIPGIRILSYADDICLLISASSVQQACQVLEQAARIAIEQGKKGAIQFDTEKTEAVLFTRKRGKELKNQVQRAKIQIQGHEVLFNSEATRWLGVWLDKGLTLKAYYHTCLRKTRRAEAQVQALCRGQGLSPGLVQRIQVAAVQVVALYGAELWWQGQKDRLSGIQRMVNRQARAITGMLKTTPIKPLIKEAALYLAEALLDRHQR